jgi:hypothetical protein
MDDEQRQTQNFLDEVGDCFNQLQENLARTGSALDALGKAGPPGENGLKILDLHSRQLADLRILLRRISAKLAALGNSAGTDPPAP